MIVLDGPRAKASSKRAVSRWGVALANSQYALDYSERATWRNSARCRKNDYRMEESLLSKWDILHISC